jgi:hypothetical protein
MNPQRRKKHTTQARAVAVVTLMLSLLSIQQVWAEEFCACDHLGPLTSADEHCSKHPARHAQGEETHIVTIGELAGQIGHNEDTDKVATHRHVAKHEHGEESHIGATQDEPEQSCRHASPDSEPSGSPAIARLEVATSNSQGDGSGAPANLICCHIPPAINLPVSRVAVYAADASPDAAPAVFEIGTARTVITSAILQPPRARPIYLAVSSLLI